MAIITQAVFVSAPLSNNTKHTNWKVFASTL